MKDFIKKLFCTKYRIYPVYQDGKEVGVVVYEKTWISPFYMMANLNTKNSSGAIENIEPAAFDSKDEAVKFIKSRTTSYNYETIHSDK